MIGIRTEYLWQLLCAFQVGAEAILGFGQELADDGRAILLQLPATLKEFGLLCHGARLSSQFEQVFFGVAECCFDVTL